MRTVSVVVLRVMRSDSRVFMQIGKCTGASVQPSCELPALRQEWGETAEETLDRMLATKLRIFSGRPWGARNTSSRTLAEGVWRRIESWAV